MKKDIVDSKDHKVFLVPLDQLEKLVKPDLLDLKVPVEDLDPEVFEVNQVPLALLVHLELMVLVVDLVSLV